MIHEPEAFYVATDQDMVRPTLHFVPVVVMRVSGGFSSPDVTRTVIVGDRSVRIPVPLIDLLDGMVAVPMTYRPPSMEAALAGRSGPDMPAENNGLGVNFGSWQLCDLKLGLDIPVEFVVNNPQGPAMTAGLRRYLVEARPRGVHVAKAWGELVGGRHDAWLKQQEARRGSVDADVVPEQQPAGPRAIGS